MLSNAKWICAPQSKDGAAVAFEKKFTVNGRVARAVLYASALGMYEPWVNGALITQNRLLPGWTNYHKRIQYQAMPVENLVPGENALRLRCAPGWAVGHVGYDGSDKNYAETICAIARLDVEYEDGSIETVCTDASWNAFTDTILYSDLYGGETVDHGAPILPLGGVAETEAEGALIPHEGEYVREMERIAPAARLTTPSGETVIDFGQNLAGYVEVRVKGKRGERIVLSHAETLDRSGNFYTANLRAAKATNTYILSGEGMETFKPSFTWQGFRYVRLDEFPEGALEDAEFTAIVIHSDMRRTGRFLCGNEKINRLYENLIWGQKGNYIDVPTDCPQRDERLGWLGDAQVFCQTAAINYDVQRFFRKWMKDVALEQREDGAVWGIAPVVMKTRVTRISAAWGDAAVICPWIIYLTYGDTQILADQYPSMCRWIDYIRRHAEGGEYLWTGGKQYGDWLAMDNGEGVYEGATPKDFIATAFYAYSTSLVIRIGRILDKDVAEYEALYANIVKAFRDRFTSDGLPSVMTQTACALMLQFDLCEDAQKVADALAQCVLKNGTRLNTGFVGTPYLLYALSEHGHMDLAYDLLLQEAYPSWLYSVNRGATTMWEHWDGVNENGEMWSEAMNSFNHYAYGAVGEWLYRTIAGIRTIEDAPGYRRIRLCPVPDARLGFAEATVDTRFGQIRSAWHIENGRVRYTFSVPDGVEAQIALPGGYCKTVCAGDYQVIESLSAAGKQAQ